MSTECGGKPFECQPLTHRCAVLPHPPSGEDPSDRLLAWISHQIFRCGSKPSEKWVLRVRSKPRSFVFIHS